MKKGFLIAGAILSGGGVLGLAAIALYLISIAVKPSESVGIIGGADGPTAIFLTGRLASPLIMALLPFVATILIGAAFLIVALVIHIRHKKPGK